MLRESHLSNDNDGSHPPSRALTPLAENAVVAIPHRVLDAELTFYQSYGWSLNPYPSVESAIEYLRRELNQLGTSFVGWQRREVQTNIFLLSCGILNCIEEYLRGPTLRLPGRLGSTPVGRVAVWLFESLSSLVSSRRRGRIRSWRDRWLTALNDFLVVAVAPNSSSASIIASGRGLIEALETSLPVELFQTRLGVPSPFSRLDLTQEDVVALGRRIVESSTDKSQPILLIGLRTSGSFFVPLIKAVLEVEGYKEVSLMTFEPSKGLGHFERSELRRFASRGYAAVIVDDPPHTAGTVIVAVGLARREGFAIEKIRVAVPTHPARPNWSKSLPRDLVVTMRPEHWHKSLLLEPETVTPRLAEYFRARGFASACVVASDQAAKYTDDLKKNSSDERSLRLKGIFEVELRTVEGKKVTKYVLAQSVGWGWLGYHAFLVGQRLAPFVPTMLGLRDGILYTEWIPQPPNRSRDTSLERQALVDVSAAYVAARARHLSLGFDAGPGMDLQRHNNGIRLLEKALSRAYGRLITGTLKRSRIGRLLRNRPCPNPTLIDGNMQRGAWIVGPSGFLKTDNIHHGMGKAALNVTDSAYDLADTILNLQLSEDEEKALVQRYVDRSGDVDVGPRLFLNKLLAGLWAMNQAWEQLFGPAQPAAKQQEFHRRFLNAWHFLTVQTARHCGASCEQRPDRRWRAPLVALDVDGVIDRRIFGFPHTTAAGIEAISLLNAGGLSVTLNTARSASEVKEYCRAYSLAGGVAEHGSYAWDALNQQGQVLISPESADQLQRLRTELRKVPGAFYDERHQYSIRAFTYREKPRGLFSSLARSLHSSNVGDGVLAPLPTLLMNHLMKDLGIDRLSFHHTAIDTTIVAKEVDKGTGLVALRNWVLGADAETIAVGDQEPDLAMFRVATRSFAPSNISCPAQARFLGCKVVGKPYQRGLLEIARALVPSASLPKLDASEARVGDSLFFEIMRAADRRWSRNLVSALFDAHASGIFVR